MAKKSKKKRRRLRPLPFQVWVEYYGSSPDLDQFLFYVADAHSIGSGTMLDESQLRDHTFDAKTKAKAIALGKKLADVLKKTRRDGSWVVHVKAWTQDSLTVWTCGTLLDYKTLLKSTGVRFKKKKRKAN